MRTRTQIQRIIHDLPMAQSAVRSSLSVQNRTVHVRMVVIGKPAQARSLQATLSTEIGKTAAIVPVVEVLAVPDLDTMEDVARKLAKSETVVPAPQADLLRATGDVAEALQRAWPEAAAGPIRRWRVDLTDREHPGLEVVHLGSPLGRAAESILASVLSERFHASFVVRDLAVPPDPITAAPGDGATWLPALASAIDWVRGDQELTACVTLPAQQLVRSGTRRKRRLGDESSLVPVRDMALAALSQAPPVRVRWSTGTRWMVQLRTEPCTDLASAQ